MLHSPNLKISGRIFNLFFFRRDFICGRKIIGPTFWFFIPPIARWNKLFDVYLHNILSLTKLTRPYHQESACINGPSLPSAIATVGARVFKSLKIFSFCWKPLIYQLKPKTPKRILSLWQYSEGLMILASLAP